MPTPHLAPGETIGEQFIRNLPLLVHPANPTTFKLRRHVVLEELASGTPAVEMEQQVDALLVMAGVRLPKTVVRYNNHVKAPCWIILAHTRMLEHITQVHTGGWPVCISPCTTRMKWWRYRLDGSIDFYIGEHQIWNAPPMYWDEHRRP